MALDLTRVRVGRKLKLVIFDADGTLCNRETGELLPGVLALAGHLHQTKAVAVATNQGGPACRDAGWGRTDDGDSIYPSLEIVEARYAAVAEAMNAKLYMSLAYYNKREGVYIFPKNVPAGDPRLDIEWRKPAPGMLLAAMRDANVEPGETVFVGDSDDDRLAAEAVGVRFIHADDYFPHGNPQWEEIEAARTAYKAWGIPESLQQKKAELEALWGDAVREHREGTHTYSFEQMMDLDGGLRNEEQYQEWEEEQRHLWNTIRLRADNLFVEVDPSDSWVKEKWDADPEGWREFFTQFKAKMSGHTYAERVGSDLDGLLQVPLKEPMQYGLISFRRTDGQHIQARLHVGDPRRGWSWLI